MFNLHSTFCLKNEPLERKTVRFVTRYPCFRCLERHFALKCNLLWTSLESSCPTTSKALDSRELSKLTQDRHNATWIHKKIDPRSGESYH